MPIYEYECDKCGHGFEREQRISDPPIKTCPACKGRKVTKLISRSSFVLKGGGWYADGYADPRKSGGDSDKAEPKTGGAEPKKSGAEPKKSGDESKKSGDGESKSGAKGGADKNASKGASKSAA